MKTHVERIRSIKVTVCNTCLRACCWAAIFMCDEAFTTAGTTVMTIGELKELKREHPTYFKQVLV